MTLRGGCLCSTVRYEAERLDTPIEHCHCRTCRKAHASAFTTSAGVLRHEFRWTNGADQLSAYESSFGKLRRFCAQCGTHLVAERQGRPHLILRVATLDDDPGTRPTTHIWTAHTVPWLTDEGEVSRLPPEWRPGR